MFARCDYLAGDDERRLAELQTALASGPSAIIAMRGGYGLSRIVDRIDWSPALAHPCWIVGFSDLTALHVEASRHGLATMHACMVCALGRGDARTRARWISCLEDPLARRRWEGLVTWRAGAAAGPAFGGNLTMLHSCAARASLRVPKGAVLILEDVGERPYRVDRVLSDLLFAGYFADVAAVVLGDFTECGPGRDGRTVETVLRERLSALRVPIVAGAPVGHGRRNNPFLLGAPVRVEACDATASCEFGPLG